MGVDHVELTPDIGAEKRFGSLQHQFQNKASQEGVIITEPKTIFEIPQLYQYPHLYVEYPHSLLLNIIDLQICMHVYIYIFVYIVYIYRYSTYIV